MTTPVSQNQKNSDSPPVRNSTAQPTVLKTNSCGKQLIDSLCSPIYSKNAPSYMGATLVTSTLGGMALTLGLKSFIVGSLALGLGLSPIGWMAIGGALLMFALCLIVRMICAKANVEVAKNPFTEEEVTPPTTLYAEANVEVAENLFTEGEVTPPNTLYVETTLSKEALKKQLESDGARHIVLKVDGIKVDNIQGIKFSNISMEQTNLILQLSHQGTFAPITKNYLDASSDMSMKQYGYPGALLPLQAAAPAEINIDTQKQTLSASIKHRIANTQENSYPETHAYIDTLTLNYSDVSTPTYAIHRKMIPAIGEEWGRDPEDLPFVKTALGKKAAVERTATQQIKPSS